jgi:hypothetical protein
MTPYASWEDFSRTYSAEAFRISRIEVESAWLVHGYLRVNESLGRCFSVPFSSNNLTARDLNVQFAFLGILERTRNREDSIELRNSIMGRISDICSGNSPMITDEGQPIYGGENKIWSSIQNYKPVFDMRDPINQHVDSNRLDDEWDEVL